MAKDPFEYMANEQMYTETSSCRKCGTSYSATNKSQSAAQGSATNQANACARRDMIAAQEEEAAKKKAAEQEAERQKEK